MGKFLALSVAALVMVAGCSFSMQYGTDLAKVMAGCPRGYTGTKEYIISRGDVSARRYRYACVKVIDGQMIAMLPKGSSLQKEEVPVEGDGSIWEVGADFWEVLDSKPEKETSADVRKELDLKLEKEASSPDNQ